MTLQDTLHRLNALGSIEQTKYFVLPIIVLLIGSYTVYLQYDAETIRQISLVREDGFFEYLTAVSFLAAAVIFVRAHVVHKNKWLILLAIVMVMGAGEEMSWGQRIIGFSTPDMMKDYNVQKEVTLHNLEIFNGHTFEREEKRGLAKLITMNFLYKLFWLSYGVILPIAFAFLIPVARLIERLRLPTPPLSIGIFFLVNWLIFRAVINSSNMLGRPELYRFPEILEAGSAFIFMIVSIFYLKNGPTMYIRKGDTPGDISSKQPVPPSNDKAHAN